jgi:uncharacterized membrane protein YkoI
MQRHILFTTVVIIWLLAPAACGAPDTATDSGSTLSADAAAEIALEHAPGANLVEAPRLVSYQGATAYEVLLEQGPLYVDAQSGTVITTSVPTVAPTSPPDVAVTPTSPDEQPTATAVPPAPTPAATIPPPEATALPPTVEPTNPPPPRPDVPPDAEPDRPPPGPGDRPRDNLGDAVGPILPEQAIRLATEAVGGGTVTEVKLERGNRDKPPMYIVKFNNDSEVRVNAQTGEIIEVKIRDKPGHAGDDGATIPPEQAIRLAADAVGAGTFKEMKLEHGNKDKPSLYIVKFDNDSEVRVNARTGEIIEVKIRDKPTEPDRGGGDGDDDDDDDD